jgi:hypothetical protein
MDRQTKSVKEGNEQMIFLAWIILLSTCAVIFYFVTVFSTIKLGYTNSCKDILANSPVFTIYSNHILPLENGNNAQSKKNLYEYSGYYGFAGQDYFVLYRELDTETNSPKEVYLLKKDEVIGFSITKPKISNSELANIATKCKVFADEKLLTSFNASRK